VSCVARTVQYNRYPFHILPIYAKFNGANLSIQFMPTYPSIDGYSTRVYPNIWMGLSNMLLSSVNTIG